MSSVWDWSPWTALRPTGLDTSPSAHLNWPSMLMLLLAATLAVRQGSRLWPGSANAQFPKLHEQPRGPFAVLHTNLCTASLSFRLATWPF